MNEGWNERKKNIRREREKKKGESFPIRNVGVEGGENLGRKVHAHISVERGSRDRGARSEGGGSPVLRLQARGHFCVSRVSLGGLRKNRGFSWS